MPITQHIWIDKNGRMVNHDHIRNQRAADGTLSPAGLMPEQLNELGYQEIAINDMPDDYSEDTHGQYPNYETTTGPYYTYPRKPQEQIDAANYHRGIAKIKALEAAELMPRTLREFLLEQPGAAQRPWFKKINDLHTEIEAIKATLPPKPQE